MSLKGCALVVRDGRGGKVVVKTGPKSGYSNDASRVTLAGGNDGCRVDLLAYGSNAVSPGYTRKRMQLLGIFL